MVRGLFNWTFKDVVTFLKDHDFQHSYTQGSHFYYVKRSSGSFQVCVPFHGSKAIKPRTLKGIIQQSGISRTAWMQKLE